MLLRLPAEVVPIFEAGIKCNDLKNAHNRQPDLPLGPKTALFSALQGQIWETTYLYLSAAIENS